MAFDPFFRKLGSSKFTAERRVFCRCREPQKGALIIDKNGELIFKNGCSAEKACFKIRFDSKKSLTQRLHIVTKDAPNEQKKEVTRPTLDKFLGLTYISLDNNKDIPKPPPPHNVERPNES
jgi:hypothetical protein